ncbi:hypothetical protein PAXRUDRAFT_627523 [Paxillus rubicundulus Ve08.2h10]|uniref:Uncharacterized protein n=1 Tax=Paxillus rubicundulus Ve08.2h10 TaxID=930991 RepID=A0A0D0DY84_9AGAM|nr:hypothetical protein PAXRUDRAFT_627523 [Paxillus rubicundulus Ve08.2h10]
MNGSLEFYRVLPRCQDTHDLPFLLTTKALNRPRLCCLVYAARHLDLPSRTTRLQLLPRSARTLETPGNSTKVTVVVIKAFHRCGHTFCIPPIISHGNQFPMIESSSRRWYSAVINGRGVALIGLQ